jgi:hypothetical protein
VCTTELLLRKLAFARLVGRRDPINQRTPMPFFFFGVMREG